MTSICACGLLRRLFIRRHVVASTAAFEHVAVVALYAQRLRERLHGRGSRCSRGMSFGSTWRLVAGGGGALVPACPPASGPGGRREEKDEAGRCPDITSPNHQKDSTGRSAEAFAPGPHQLRHRLYLLGEREPPPVLRALASDDGVECLLNTTCDAAGFTSADHAAVDFADRRDFDGGSGEEQFVGVDRTSSTRNRRDRRRECPDRWRCSRTDARVTPIRMLASSIVGRRCRRHAQGTGSRRNLRTLRHAS